MSEPQADKPNPELLALARAAGALDNEMGPGSPGDGQEGQGGPNPGDGGTFSADPVEENRALLDMALTMLVPVMPFLAECYPPEKVKSIATALTAVEQKHGWSLTGLMGKWAPEIGLCMVTIPPTVQAIALGRVHFAKVRAAQAAAKQEAARKAANDGKGAPPDNVTPIRPES